MPSRDNTCMHKFALVSLLLSLPPADADLTAVIVDDLGEPAELADFFAHPGPALSRVSGGFGMIALSNLAEYYASRQHAGTLAQPVVCSRLGQIVDLALGGQINPYPIRKSGLPASLGGNGLYLSHLNIALAARRAVCGDGQHDDLGGRISRHLRRKSLNRWAHAQSYSGRRQRWPADQAALLYSLWLHDRNTGGTLSAAPISRWLAYLSAAGLSDHHGLPVSEVTGATPTSKVPRGCALTFMVRYMAAFAPDEATALWQKTRTTLRVDVFGLSGLREWPPGYRGGTDVDSGPIVWDVGSAATGLGIGAARVVGDAETHRRLQRTMAVVYGLAPEPLQKIGNTILARSIALFGEAAERW